MQNWFSCRFEPVESETVFLVRGLLPFLREHVWAQPGRRAFYIRYDDEGGAHLRIRIKSESEGNMEEAFADWMEGRGNWTALPYEPEVDRFGGTSGLPWAEEHFHLSTRVALERLSLPEYLYGDALFDAVVSHVIAAYALGLSRGDSAGWFAGIYRQWLPLFFRTAAGEAPNAVEQELIESRFAQSLQQQGADLRDSLNTLWLQLEGNRIATDRPEWLRWLRGNELVLPNFDKHAKQISSSLLHLHSNRLGVHNQDEVFVLYLLSNCL